MPFLGIAVSPETDSAKAFWGEVQRSPEKAEVIGPGKRGKAKQLWLA